MDNAVLNSRLVDLSLTALDWREAVTLLSRRLSQEGKITALDRFILAVLQRESIMSTFCGNLIAIPHAVSTVVRTPALCIGRSAGLAWQTPEEWVRLVFLLAIPESRPGDQNSSKHVEILSTIATLALDETCIQKWLNAATADEVVASINNALTVAWQYAENKENHA